MACWQHHVKQHAHIEDLNEAHCKFSHLHTCHLQGEHEVNSNAIQENLWHWRAEKVMSAAAKGPMCWDCEYYKQNSADLAQLDCLEAFKHFVNFGQFESARPSRYETTHSGCKRTTLLTAIASLGTSKTGCADKKNDNSVICPFQAGCTSINQDPHQPPTWF